MLVGTYSSNITSGKRVAIPAKFREEIGKELVVARWYEKCLVLVSKDAWNELLQKLTGKSEFVTAPVRDTDRFIMGSAYEFEADAQGRIVLPQILMEYAGLADEVLFMGLGDRVEIWSKSEWKARERYISEHASELMEKVAEQKS